MSSKIHLLLWRQPLMNIIIYNSFLTLLHRVIRWAYHETSQLQMLISRKPSIFRSSTCSRWKEHKISYNNQLFGSAPRAITMFRYTRHCIEFFELFSSKTRLSLDAKGLTLYGMAYFWPLFRMRGDKNTPLSEIWTGACWIMKLCTHFIQPIRSLNHSCFFLWHQYFCWCHQFSVVGVEL